VVAAARNPVCNLSLMIGTTDIPDWCHMVSCGPEAKQYASESPSPDHLRLFHQKSPIAHISKVLSSCLNYWVDYLFCWYMVHGTSLIVQVKAPLLMLLGGADLRVPASNGLQVHEYLLRFTSTILLQLVEERIGDRFIGIYLQLQMEDPKFHSML
jgi:acylaminoacyl-peptidase